MPKVGIEPVRRSALVEATIHEIGKAGSLEVTVSQIARRAGVSSALAHHYFGSKDQIFLAAMRHILSLYGAEVRGARLMAKTHRERVEAVIRASFSPNNFSNEVISAWLNFYVQSLRSDEAHRLLRVYQKRLISNLKYDLKPMLRDEAGMVAETIAAMIDGVYIRQGLRRAPADSDGAIEMLMTYLDARLDGKSGK